MRNRCWQLRDNFLTWRRMKQWYLFCHSVLSDLEFIFRWFQSISLSVNTSSLFQRPLMSIWAFPFTLLSFDHTLKSSNLISAFGGFLPMGMDHFHFHVYQCCTMEILLAVKHISYYREDKYQNIWYQFRLRLSPPEVSWVFVTFMI